MTGKQCMLFNSRETCYDFSSSCGRVAVMRTKYLESYGIKYAVKQFYVCNLFRNLSLGPVSTNNYPNSSINLQNSHKQEQDINSNLQSNQNILNYGQS